MLLVFENDEEWCGIFIVFLLVVLEVNLLFLCIDYVMMMFWVICGMMCMLKVLIIEVFMIVIDDGKG